MERKRADFEGKVRISDRHAFFTRCPTQDHVNSETTFHLLEGLEENPIHYYTYFTDD